MGKTRTDAEQQIAELLRTAKKSLHLSVAFLSRLDGTISRVVFGPDAHRLDYGRTPAPPQGPAASLRGVGGGGVLRFAGCDAPAHWCDVHHLIHWADGGDTSLENSGLLCERHHTKVHHGFRIVRDADGRWHTYRPDGTEILVLPRLTDEPVTTRAG